MDPFLPNEPERASESAWACEETKAALEEAQTFAEHESRSRKNRRRKCFSLPLQSPAIPDGSDAMATGCRESAHPMNSAAEPAFSAILLAYSPSNLAHESTDQNEVVMNDV